MERKRKLSSHPDVKEHLICAICTDIFRDPRNLACGHVFCKKCLDKLNERQLCSPVYGPIIGCPTCRQETILPKRGVNELSRNLPILGLLDQDLLIKRNPTCSEHNQERRDIYCSTCLVYICFKCFQGIHSHHVIKTSSEFLEELSQKTDDAKQQYQVQLKTLENNLLEADLEIQKMRSAKQSIDDEYKAKLAQLNQNRTVRLQSLSKTTKKWESDVAQFKENGKQFKNNLAIAVPKLESKTLDDLDGEDLKCYVKNVDNVMNLLKTDIGVEHLRLWNKLLVPSAASRPQPGSVPSSSGGTTHQAFQKASPKSVNQPL